MLSSFLKNTTTSIPSHKYPVSQAPSLISIVPKNLTMNPAEESRKRRNYDVLQSSNDRSISPPPKRHATTVNHIPEAVAEGRFLDNVAAPAKLPATDDNSNSKSNKQSTISLSRNVVQSPVQLNFIEELPASSNVDCISLGSILGDPMIKECWLFNYLFDIDFVM